MDVKLVEGETGLTLDDISQKVNAEHGQFLAKASTALEHGLRAGQLLIDAKAMVAHGEWLPWLKDSFDGSHDVASKYMRAAESYPLLLAANFDGRRNLTTLEAVIAASKKLAVAEKPPSAVPAAEIVTCPNCGHDKFDEHGDCEKCREPDVVDGEDDTVLAEFDLEAESEKAKVAIRAVFRHWPKDKDGHVAISNVLDGVSIESRKAW